jgi:acyl-CoA synthetase (AMP-forming)/AMP-acid ligase II
MLQLADLIARHARFRPGAPAFTCGDRTLSYAEFGRQVACTAQVLRTLGVQSGDRVATLLPNCSELVTLYWAAPMIGAVNVPLSPLLMGAGLSSLLNDAQPVCLVTQRALLPVVEAVRAELPAALRERIVVIDGPAAGALDLPSLVAEAGPATPAAVNEAQLFNIMYTSGTTGLPKGIMHSHRVRAMYGLLMGAAWRMTPESVVLHSGAIVFNGAFVTLMPCFYLGAHYVLARQFDACETIDLIERHRVTHIMLVPAQIIALLAAPNFAPEKLASLQMILSLGAPLMQQHKDTLNRLLPGRFYELYGLTEGFVTILDVRDSVRKSGSVGVPPPFYQLRIVRDDGQDAAVGEVGEIVGRGPILMDGYYNKPELTAQTVRDGWLYSGDVGWVDDEGFLHLVDRKKDMIDSGGIKVYPRDVEEVAIRHPAVLEVAVFGIPDPKWGETPAAAVVLRERGAATEDELLAFINANVAARFQRVTRVIVMDAFPRNAAGKTLKRELREPFWRGRAKQI